ncbi:TPA: hypothetical protein UL921_001059 [Stenotrophomonas maltophilia]|uniref:hypothetical protein n=1 Tax=Stenotrophomonas maltophilia TaxID=40324 RepID=UPI0021D9FD2A|nr:hypothetical protein [Stenotrophomonas maltophilia]UXY49877.1 hypothetical protein N8888_08145 [Stenotrophomonas maltophilia]HEL7629278.1 hypothetical protein [Stenotrophomonas maltophilia]
MTTNLDLARRVAKHVEIQVVTLRSSSVKTNFDVLNIPGSLGLRQGYRAACDDSRFRSEGILTILVGFVFHASDAPEDEDTEPSDSDALVVEAEYGITYSIDRDVDLDAKCLEHFAKVNGPYNAWPYWRELVQSISGRVGLTSITVPVFRPPEHPVDDADCQ